MLTSQDDFVVLIKDFTIFDHHAEAGPLGIIPLFFDGHADANRIADKDRLDETKPVVPVGNASGFTSPAVIPTARLKMSVPWATRCL